MSGNGGYIPHYRLLLAGLGLEVLDPALQRTQVDTGFLTFLLEEFARLLPFDAEFYARTHPDVARAVAAGTCAGLQEHFIHNGFREGRRPSALPYEPAAYVAANPDLAGLLQAHGPAALRTHFLDHGRHEGRAAHPTTVDAARRWQAMAAATVTVLAARSLSNALVTAFHHPLVAAPGSGFRGGPVLEAAADAPLRHRRGGVPVDSFPDRDVEARVLPGEYVYGGFYWHHFGHVMAECIHRILPARAAFGCRRLLFVGTGIHPDIMGWEALPAVMRHALAFLGVAPHEVTVVHDHYRAETLHMVQQGSDLTGGPAREYLPMLARHTAPRLADLGGPPPQGGRVYVSRSRLKHGGMVLGEAWIETQLATQGWTILHPEALPLERQMQAYEAADTLLFAEGSAIHGTELLGTNSLGACYVLERRTSHRALFRAVLAPRSRSWAPLPCTIPAGSVVADAAGAPLEHYGVSLYNLPALAALLREHGLAIIDGGTQGYADSVQTDLAAYLEHHRAAGTRLHDPEGLAKRCTLLLQQKE